MSQAPPGAPPPRILLGLLFGALLGSLVNYTTAPRPVPARDALAALLGNGAVPPPQRAEWGEWVVRNVTKPVGDIFLNLLFLAIIPLVFASLAVGVTRL